MPATPTDMSNGASAPSTPAPPPVPSNPSPQQPNPQQQRISGVKGYLANILHGVGEGMKVHLGMETDEQKQQRLFTQNLQTQQLQNQQANIQSEIMQRAAVVKQMQSAVTLPNGMQVPFALAKPYIDAWGKQQAAATGKRFMIVPNVGMLDTQPEGGGAPKLVPGSSPQGVQVTPEIAQQYNIPLQLIGKSMPLGQFAQLERGGAAWAGNVSNTVETKEVSDPNNPGSTMLVQIPKTTSSQKVAPGSSVVPTATPQAPGQQPVAPTGNRPPVSLTNRNGIRILTGPNGQPLQGKSATDTVYATDPKTGQQIFTTRTEAAAQGLQTPMKVSAPEVRKDQALSNRLADVQRKVGDYAATFDQPIDEADKWAISYLMDHNIGMNISAGGFNASKLGEGQAAGTHASVGMSIIPGYVQDQLKRAGIGKLSENGMRRFIQFNQARESLSGYQQILTNSSRSSDKILELQLEQLPPPIADAQFANMTTGEFQKNIDLAGQHIPIFPGSAETQQGIKAQQMARRTQAANIQATFNKGAAAQQEPPRPANVPQNYVYKVNGPKGTGWYRP